MNLWIGPAKAEIDTGVLIGEWCLTQRSMTDYDTEGTLPRTIRENLKTAVGQSYHFVDAENVDITLVDGSTSRFTYEISGSKRDRVKIKKWERFFVRSLTNEEMRATVLGTVKHRFVRGNCD
jgi:hypothetical protein